MSPIATACVLAGAPEAAYWADRRASPPEAKNAARDARLDEKGRAMRKVAGGMSTTEARATDNFMIPARTPAREKAAGFALSR